ncbi:MAG: glycosyltransferase family 2 protein [Solirubrobacteraceae bacterium]
MIAVVAAQNEAVEIGATLAALREAFPLASLWVADDGSSDATAAIARAAEATVVRGEVRSGKGFAMTRAVGEALDRCAAGASGEPNAHDGSDPVLLLCDGDLGTSAARLAPLVRAVQGGDADLAVAAFAKREGGGFGIAVGFARWAIRRRCGFHANAPLSGQRAMPASRARGLLPFADGYGMELDMTIDAVRRGLRVREIELDLSHRVSGRIPAGFLHRGRQLLDCVRVYLATR